MPEGGVIKIKQEVVTDALNVLARVKQMFESEDIAHAIRYNEPYQYSQLTTKIQDSMTKLTAEILKSLELDAAERAESKETL